MSKVKSGILAQVIESTAEPVAIVGLDRTDWPVVFGNPAFVVIAGEESVDQPFADVIEALLGRELALEISESMRARAETSFPVEAGGREYLLALKPLYDGDDASHCAVIWRSAGGSAAAGDETHHALLSAKRTIRDLTRDDPVTGLLNSRAFREVLSHDWAVAAREESSLALVLFELDDFDAYVEVFGRHASDSCLRRVGQAVRRSLRRASDVVARMDGARFVVLSHAADEPSVVDFAARIATAVRELGLHHPRSSSGRFVTVSHRVVAKSAGRDAGSGDDLLCELLGEN